MPLQTVLAHFDAPILLIHPLSAGKLGVITSDHQIYLYDTLTQEKEKIVRLNVAQEATLHYAFDPHHMRLIFGMENTHKLHLIDLKKKKFVNRFDLDRQSPTAIAYSPDGRHFICGTDQGRVLLWRQDSDTLIARLHSFPEYNSLYTKPKINFVSAIAFHDNEVATTGYGGSIVITDYLTQIQTKRFTPGRIKNTALLFYKNSLIVGNQDGSLLKIDREKKLPNQRLSVSAGAIKHLLRIDPEPYILASSGRNSIQLINADTLHIIIDRFIQLEHPIVSIGQANGKLYVATQAGEVHGFDLKPLAQLESLIRSEAYAEAYRYCDQEPPVRESLHYRTLESLFQHTFLRAQKMLENGKITEAKALLAPFGQAKSKEITALTSAYSQIDRLRYLFDHQKFSPFYGLVEYYPLLCSTTLFEKAEQLWSDHFTQAQKLMLMKKTKEAQSELLLFSAVNSKRPFIQLLIHHFDTFKLYSKAVHEHRFDLLNPLIRRYPVLRKLPSYVQMVNEAGELPNAIVEALKAQHFEQARLWLDELGTAEVYESQHRHLTSFVFTASNLHRALKNGQWRSVYQLLDQSPDLTLLPWAQEIEDQWNRTIRRCETFAVHADVRAIKQELGPLISLPHRNERIGDIFRTAYQIQLKTLLKETPERFGEGVGRYCEFFGIDTELRQLIKISMQRPLHPPPDTQKLQPKNRDEWLLSIRRLPDSLV